MPLKMASLCLEYKVTRKKRQLNCGCCNQINQVTKLSTYIFGVSELFLARNLLLHFFGTTCLIKACLLNFILHNSWNSRGIHRLPRECTSQDHKQYVLPASILVLWMGQHIDGWYPSINCNYLWVVELWKFLFSLCVCVCVCLCVCV